MWSNLSFQQIIYGVNQFLVGRFGLRGETGDRMALSVEQELGEIPFYFTGKRGSFGQVSVQRMDIVALDADFRHHWKSNIEAAGAEFQNLFIGARFLAGEIAN